MSLPGGGLAVGGGGLGLVGLLIYLAIGLLSSNGGLSAPLQNLDDRSVGAGSTPDCTTAQDANTREDCRIVGDINSIQAYWISQFKASGRTYAISKTVFFDGSTSSGCGTATTDVGPFYCPVDKNVYIDLGFFDELRDRFGATAGPFAQAYVLAHEYGHHVQDQLGALRSGSGQTGAQGTSVRTELQADCYAGVWAHNAASTGFIEPLSPDQIAAADAAAKAVGDDHIQQSTQGQVDPDSFTHGTSEQRVRWFTRGYDSGAPSDCDTFNATSL